MKNMQDSVLAPLPRLRERNLPDNCRPALTELLKQTFGYDSFRDLEIYDDLFKSKDKLTISQGQLVERVVQEVEKTL